MNGTTLATSLLGHRVRLTSPPAGATAREGRIVTVYLDADGMHYVVLVEGHLVNVADGNQFTVLPDRD
jgi:hypothetical protein